MPARGVPLRCRPPRVDQLALRGRRAASESQPCIATAERLSTTASRIIALCCFAQTAAPKLGVLPGSRQVLVPTPSRGKIRWTTAAQRATCLWERPRSHNLRASHEPTDQDSAVPQDCAAPSCAAQGRRQCWERRSGHPAPSRGTAALPCREPARDRRVLRARGQQMTGIRAQLQRHLPILALWLIMFAVLGVFILMWPR